MDSKTLDQFEALGVDVDLALEKLARTPISLQCWQGDDVAGFENSGSLLDGGLAVTGNYPGRARNIDELWSDLELALSQIPGAKRLNLHASYGDFRGKKVNRNEIQTDHFEAWIDWARELGIGLDFNPTYFSHPMASDGWTLAHSDSGIREFWIDHGIACRTIGKYIGQRIGLPCVTNFWIPDGFKDTPADRVAPRQRLTDSLDRIFSQSMDAIHNIDSVESKLFGIGSESFVAGSHEFYLGYAITRKKYLCLDSGHFHPTESIADKISAVLPFVPGLMLHISRGVRWDSDHVVSLNDDTLAITRELTRLGKFDKTHIGLDFFDASINRVAAWIIGTRNVQKALMMGFLEPFEKLKALECDGDLTGRLALMEEVKMLPFGVVWNAFCDLQNVPRDGHWQSNLNDYEQSVLNRRD